MVFSPYHSQGMQFTVERPNGRPWFAHRRQLRARHRLSSSSTFCEPSVVNGKEYNPQTLQKGTTAFERVIAQSHDVGSSTGMGRSPMETLSLGVAAG